MTTLLVTNDDGVSSPALIPLIRALQGIAAVRRVHALVPDRERSWISKAVTRFEEVHVGQREAQPGDPPISTATGTPADCANLGIHRVFDGRPDLVVSGINVGLNHGLAFVLSSGTVGAAAEGVVAGLPAVAFSIGVQEDHASFVERARSDAGGELWRRSSAVAADIVASVLQHGLPEGVDLLNVNFPEQVNRHTPRVISEVARVGYDALFAQRGDRRYAYDYRGLKERQQGAAPTDLAVLRRGLISITPLRLPQAAPIDAELRNSLEMPAD